MGVGEARRQARWQPERDFHAGRAPREGRAALLEEACAGTKAYARDRIDLLEAHDRDDDFLEAPAYEAAAGCSSRPTPSADRARGRRARRECGRAERRARLSHPTPTPREATVLPGDYSPDPCSLLLRLRTGRSTRTRRDETAGWDYGTTAAVVRRPDDAEAQEASCARATASSRWTATRESRGRAVAALPRAIVGRTFTLRVERARAVRVVQTPARPRPRPTRPLLALSNSSIRLGLLIGC